MKCSAPLLWLRRALLLQAPGLAVSLLLSGYGGTDNGDFEGGEDFDGCNATVCIAPWIFNRNYTWDRPQAEREKLLAQRPVRRVAICMSGHFRTFGLPGVHTSFVRNVIESIPWKDAKADIYLDGLFGNRGHRRWYKGWQCPRDASDPGVQAGLRALRPYLRSAEFYDVTRGDCNVLKEAWSKDHIANRSCKQRSHDANFFQFMFMDRCMQKIFRSEERYDLIIKTRPDVAVFRPLPWENISLESVSFTPKRYGAGEDWFFTIPGGSVAREFWEEQVRFYMNYPGWALGDRFAQQPDHKFFPKIDDFNRTANVTRAFLQNPMLFPAVIVRGNTSSFVDCVRIPSHYYQKHCNLARDQGNMTWVTHELSQRRHK